MAESHWWLLQNMDSAVEAAGRCVITVHDLDETDILTGLMALLAVDEAGEPRKKAASEKWNSHDDI